ncbi:hypothetical protein CRUP_005116 [Coryphaenoides rupestris]|nr:hypothetical protein CRUP_005116 [Coryphaenoides rupestris]
MSRFSNIWMALKRLDRNVSPKPRTIAMSVINKSTKNRLQSIDRRLERSADQSTVVVEQL